MNTKLVIFDKDGTLLDFDAFWVTITRKAIEDLLDQLSAPASLMDALLASIGVQNGVTDVQGILAWGTYRTIGETLHKVLTAHGVACDPETVASITAQGCHAHANEGRLEPVCPNLRGVLDSLRRQAIQLAVVTTDGPAITRQCLEELGIADCFSDVCTDDGILPPKPDPYCIGWLCKKYGLNRDEMVMVGDTLTDVRFARSGGIRVIGVAKTQSGRDFLRQHADAAVPDVSHVAEVLAIWESGK